MLHKSFGLLETKADGQTGTFEAHVAVFGNVDYGGDRIQPGAFAKSIDRLRAAGDPLPVIWDHQHSDPMAHIGTVDPADLSETSQGLLVKGTFDVADNPMARQVHRLMKRRSLKEFSFGYQVPKGGEKVASDGANDLREIDLFEVGPTLKGMNPLTVLHAVKSEASLLRKQDIAMVRLLNSMAGQARKFIADEDDADDITAMQSVLQALVALGAEEQAEPAEPAGEKHQPSSASTEPPPPAAAPNGRKHSDPPPTAADPLMQTALNVLLDLQAGDVERRKSPDAPAQPPPSLPSKDELERRYWDAQIDFLTS